MKLVFTSAILSQLLLTNAHDTDIGGEKYRTNPRKTRFRNVLSQLQSKASSGSTRQQTLGQLVNLSSKKNTRGSNQKKQCDPSVNDSFYAPRHQDHNADVGILSSTPSTALCTPEQYCLPDATSTLGGFCEDFDVFVLEEVDDATTDTGNHYKQQQGDRRRHLQYMDLSTACSVQEEESYYYVCDCSNFNLQQDEGTVSCILYEYECFLENEDDEEVCGSLTMELTRNGTEEWTEYCYHLTAPMETDVCYSYDWSAGSCSIAVNGTECSSCSVVDGIEHPVYGYVSYGCYQFDCTNTLVEMQGNDCLGSRVLGGLTLDEVLYDDANMEVQTESPTTSAPTTAPTATESSHPTTSSPTVEPTNFPTHAPTRIPTVHPTTRPTTNPTMHPTTRAPTQGPTSYPSLLPTPVPTDFPTRLPTVAPTVFATTLTPTRTPTITHDDDDDDDTNNSHRTETFYPTSFATASTDLPTISIRTSSPTYTTPSPSYTTRTSPPSTDDEVDPVTSSSRNPSATSTPTTIPTADRTEDDSAAGRVSSWLLFPLSVVLIPWVLQ
eukprot:Nitzschia sp. Nitz4//scaffold185_size43419//28718//30370//NITZ4_007305-RA/size43419-processed-gene-0.76-mRNA-1//1//CDS//3329539721//7723//frame0